jgi:probable phosphomutase (TIGR03848 family)
MALFLLIRHGENEYVKKGRLAGRLPGVHLNETGRSQAHSLADKLKEAPIKAVYSSPLERTMETAAPIAEALGQEVIPREGLIETDYGEWQDKKLKGLSRLDLWRVVQNRPSMMHFPQGELMSETQQRICRELLDLSRQHDPKDLVVCVSHSDPIKLAVAYFIGLPLDNFQRLQVTPASITALIIGQGFSHLIMLNYDLSLGFSPP